MEIMSKEHWLEWTEIFREERLRELQLEMSNVNGKHQQSVTWAALRRVWREEL